MLSSPSSFIPKEAFYLGFVFVTVQTRLGFVCEFGGEGSGGF